MFLVWYSQETPQKWFDSYLCVLYENEIYWSKLYFLHKWIQWFMNWVLFLHFWPQPSFPLLLKSERFQSDCCKTIYTKQCKITETNLSSFCVKSFTLRHWNLENSQKRRVAETDYTLLWKMDNTFCLAGKLEAFTKPSSPLWMLTVSLFVETQLSCFAFSLLSCVHAPFSSWMSSCCKGQCRSFHLPLQVKARITDGCCAPASLLTMHPLQGLAASAEDFPGIRESGVIQRAEKEE